MSFAHGNPGGGEYWGVNSILQHGCRRWNPLDNDFRIQADSCLGFVWPEWQNPWKAILFLQTDLNNALCNHFRKYRNSACRNVMHQRDLIDTDKTTGCSRCQRFALGDLDMWRRQRIELYFRISALMPNEYTAMSPSVKTKNELAAGTTVTNKANIYFGFHFIIRNAAKHDFRTGIGKMSS